MIRNLLVLCMLLFSVVLFAQQPDSTTLIQVGQVVPNFPLTTLDGQTMNIRDLNSRVVLINFFATWCPACNMEMPELEKQIWLKHKREGLWVIAIGREHTGEDLVAYRTEKTVTFPMAPDSKRDIFKRFAKQNIPRNILIDRKGVIAYQSVGYSPEIFQELNAAVEKCLQNR